MGQMLLAGPAYAGAAQSGEELELRSSQTVSFSGTTTATFGFVSTLGTVSAAGHSLTGMVTIGCTIQSGGAATVAGHHVAFYINHAGSTLEFTGRGFAGRPGARRRSP
ncbi:MAG: hypothetical protein KY469_15880 [Actinobacteria bacterium]|nr:hypothetical protein [Actinomycetota bacterium]